MSDADYQRIPNCSEGIAKSPLARIWRSRPSKTESADSLKHEIFEKVAEFYNLEHQEQPFVPGQTKIHYAGRVYDQREMLAMVDAVLEFWLTLGRYAEEFEEKLAEFLGVSDAVFVNSGSSANLLAVATLCSQELEGHLEPGDEVITPAVTFPTTVGCPPDPKRPGPCFRGLRSGYLQPRRLRFRRSHLRENQGHLRAPHLGQPL